MVLGPEVMRWVLRKSQDDWEGKSWFESRSSLVVFVPRVLGSEKPSIVRDSSKLNIPYLTVVLTSKMIIFESTLISGPSIV